MENILAAQQTPDDKSPNPKLPPVRDAVINQQVTTLLQIVGSCTGNLAVLEGNEVEIETVGGPADGGPKLALAQTIVQANQRLQDILSDKRCWDISERVTLEQHSVEVFELKKQSLRANMAPHTRFKPQFQWLPSFNKWMVWVGDLNNPNGHILGLGDVVEDAIAAFDRAFTQARKDQTINITQRPNEQATQVDRNRTSDPAGNAAGQNPPSGNGGEVGRKHRRRK